MKTAKLFFLISLIFSGSLFAQTLKPGYDAKELLEVLLVSARTGGNPSYFSDSNYIAPPSQFKLVYKSPEIGLLNLWELWTRNDKTAIITIRGTIPKADSWLVNFYAAMVPAKGKIKLSATDSVDYELATDPKAAIHVGWLTSTLFLANDILPRIDSCYRMGIKDIIITGHSQGGAISYLLTAHLLSLKKQGRLPADIQFKTYSTAAPKPGNLYFAYDYETATQGGWAFNIVNREDWVPEVPMSIQTIHDFNTINPFIGAEDAIKKQKFPKRMVLKTVYKKLSKPAIKAQENYEKYLGKTLSKEIEKKLPGFQVNEYYHSNHYVRTGVTILLQPGPDYFKRFQEKKGDVFVNHFHHAYIFLVDKTKLDPKAAIHP
jgi:hypothetical protein